MPIPRSSARCLCILCILQKVCLCVSVLISEVLLTHQKHIFTSKYQKVGRGGGGSDIFNSKYLFAGTVLSTFIWKHYSYLTGKYFGSLATCYFGFYFYIFVIDKSFALCFKDTNTMHQKVSME